MRFTKGQLGLVASVIALALLFAGVAERIYADQILPHRESRSDGEHEGKAQQSPAGRGPAAGDQQQANEQAGQAGDQQQQAGAHVGAATAVSYADALAEASLRGGRVAFDVSLVFNVLAAIGVVVAAISLNDWLGSKRRVSDRCRLVVDAVYADVAEPEWHVRNVGGASVKFDASVWHGDSVQLLAQTGQSPIAGAGRLRPGGKMAFTSDGTGRFAVVTAAFVEDDGAHGHCFAVFEAKGGPSRMHKVGEGYRYE